MRSSYTYSIIIVILKKMQHFIYFMYFQEAIVFFPSKHEQEISLDYKYMLFDIYLYLELFKMYDSLHFIGLIRFVRDL